MKLHWIGFSIRFFSSFFFAFVVLVWTSLFLEALKVWTSFFGDHELNCIGNEWRVLQLDYGVVGGRQVVKFDSVLFLRWRMIWLEYAKKLVLFYHSQESTFFHFLLAYIRTDSDLTFFGRLEICLLAGGVGGMGRLEVVFGKIAEFFFLL